MKRKLLLFLTILLGTISPSFAQTYSASHVVQSTDCKSDTSGKTHTLCYEADSKRLFQCVPSVVGELCNTPGEWKPIQVTAIGKDEPDNSVLLDLSSTSKALRVTRTSNPLINIVPARHGMIVYDSTDNELQQYTNGTWKNIGTINQVGDCAGGNCFNNDDGGTQLTGQLTGDSIVFWIDDHFTFWLDNDNTVTFQGMNQSQTATDTVYDTYDAGTIRIGSDDVTAVEIRTDGAGTDELVVPRDSIGPDEILNQDSSDVESWVNDPLGTGQLVFSSALDNFVIGPVSVTDNRIARYDGTTGKLIQNSGATIDDSGNISANNLSGTNTGDQSLTNYVQGPSSATDNAIARYDGTTGKLIQDTSGITIDDNSNISLPAISNSSSNGTIYKGTITAANRFLHTYMGATTTIRNIFIGIGAGNFTMASAGQVWEGGGLIGIGDGALASVTTGYSNVAIGISSMTLVTTAQDNVAIGPNTLTRLVTNGNNVAIGTRALQFNTGAFNFCMGNNSCQGVAGSSTGGANTAVGYNSGKAITTGTGNFLMGYQAGDAITTGSSNIVIGYNLDTTSATVSNEMNIGGVLYGTDLAGTPKLGIGVTPTNITARLHLPAGTATASTAPLKLTSGSLLSSKEAGAFGFLTDKLYFTITTGTAEKEITLNDSALASGTFPIATTNGRLTDSTFTSTNLVSGTYTPTRSAEANLDSNVTMTQAQYLRVGNTVTVSGAFTADPTLTTTATSFEITLPVASNIGATDDAAGVAFSGAIAGQGAEIIGVVANDTAKIQWNAVDVTSQSWSYTFTYQII